MSKHQQNAFVRNFKKDVRHIKLSERDLFNLKKNKRMYGRDFVISVVDDSVGRIRMFGKRQRW